jgi:hypothetical protein
MLLTVPLVDHDTHTPVEIINMYGQGDRFVRLSIHFSQASGVVFVLVTSLKLEMF